MSEPLRILLVEDQEADAILIQRELRRDGLAFTARRVDRDETMLRALREFTPDLVLSDFALPGFSGLEALAILRKERPDVPLIFVSGTVGEEQAVELLKMGATDYVLKGNLARLPGSVKRTLREVALERERHRAAAHYREVFENAVVGIYQATADGRLLTVNGALAAMYGYATPSEMIAAVGNSAALFVDPVRAGEFAAGLATEEVRHFRAETRRKNGSRFWVAQHASVVPAGPGVEARYEGFVEDITALREEAVHGAGAAGNLTGTTAHDLNNVLSPISMAVSMLRGSVGEKEREKMLTIIEDSARRASEIVRGVLGAGLGAAVKPGKPLEFGQVIKAVFQKLPQTWPDALRIKLAVADDLWRVAGDSAQIEQAILALCVNAGQAMPEGGTLRLGVANRQIETNDPRPLPDAKPGPYVVVEVGDTGPGIAPEVVARVFNPFAMTKAAGEKAGQGLAMVRDVAQSHGGFVDIAGGPGRGTTFKLYLPATRRTGARPLIPSVRAVPAGPGVAKSPGSGGKRNGECILLVDDEETIRFAAKAVLSKQGYRVLTATDGADALKVFNARGGEIALVLTDLMMPVMDGMTLVPALRQVRPGLPIIMSSGENEKTRLAEIQAAGVNAVLSKPYASEVLLRTVEEVLDAARKDEG